MDNEIFEALFEIVTFFNRPQQDRELLQQAQVHLEPAALPIIVWVGRQPGVSVGELAEAIGRNHSSISRQVDKLIVAGWLTESERQDQRVRQLILTAKGQRGLMQIKVARHAALNQRLVNYSPADRAQLQQVLQRLAGTLAQPHDETDE